jgi:hypothetical protein
MQFAGWSPFGNCVLFRSHNLLLCGCHISHHDLPEFSAGLRRYELHQKPFVFFWRNFQARLKTTDRLISSLCKSSKFYNCWQLNTKLTYSAAFKNIAPFKKNDMNKGLKFASVLTRVHKSVSSLG